MREEVERLLERMWKDIAGLPWRDERWSEPAKEAAKRHFLGAAIDDIMLVISQEQLKLEEDKNAPTTSKDD